MNEKKPIYKPRPISGFPEWLPEVRLVEQRWLDHIRRVFESYGYCSIETPAVEELAVIAAKGEDVDKEIYVLDRLQADESEKKETRLALHFDQTVPLARYVAQNFNELVYPFKRYQMQKVWRGERPQMGRMREFYQCDIDVINPDNLPLSFDAECAAVMYEVVSGLPDADLGRVQLRISNRKILIGFMQEMGIHNPDEVIRIIDKIEKIGEAEAIKEIKTTSKEAATASEFLISLVKIRVTNSDDLQKKIADIIDLRLSTSFGSALFDQGIGELAITLDNLAHLNEKSPGAVVADLSIVRGLDYYTGTVYETQLLDVPEFTGSVCSGGRYDDLAGNYINKHLPGVGISLGFSRLFDVMRQTGRLKVQAKSPAHILLLLLSESQRGAANAKARSLRESGLNVEVFHAPSKINKQFAYAEKKGIPYIYIPMDDEASVWEIKDMHRRTQMPENEGLQDLERLKK
ncbi:MAG: histidine--tRNA ligase [Alphaproteobacteria bacterium]|nr:histidine--tRNA ligase [Alphaproteobacteria bacterium]